MSDLPIPEGAIPATQPAIPAVPRLPRVWPAVIIVALMWATLLIVPRIDADKVEFLNDFVKFMMQFLAVGVGALLFLAWWFFFSRVPWKDRLLLPLVAALVGGIAYGVGTETIGFTLMMRGVPYLMAAGVGWLLVARGLPWSVQRIGVVAVMVLSFGYCALIRWDGMTGGFKESASWRWVPTPEDEYLASLATRNAAVPVPLENAAPVVLQPGDWPAFRGPERDNRVPNTHFAADWQRQPPREVWRRKVGPGWGSFAVVNKRLYTQEQRGEQELVMCWEADTGHVIWEHEDTARFTEAVAGPGPRATPTFHDGKIYTLGGLGNLNCIDAATGTRIWSKDVAVESGRDQRDKSDRAPIWGYSSSPLVTHGVVVVFAGGPLTDPPRDKALLAFDAATGELQWSAGTGGHSYVSAQLATLQGVEQILIATDAGVLAYDSQTHEELWRYDWIFENGQRCCQPAVLDDSDFLIGTPMNQGLKRVRVSRDGSTWSTNEVWSTKALSPYFSDLVVHKGQIYGFNGPFLTCADVTDGKRRWRVRGYDTGQVLLLADQDLLLVVSEQGDLALVAAIPDEHRELSRVHAIDGKTWNHPVVAHGRVYVRNGEEAACYELPAVSQDQAAKP